MQEIKAYLLLVLLRVHNTIQLAIWILTKNKKEEVEERKEAKENEM